MRIPEGWQRPRELPKSRYQPRAPRRTADRDSSAAVKKLLDFARVDSVDPRLGELFDGQAAEWEMPILNGYLMYGHRDADGKRLVDRFLTTRGRLLSTGVAAALRTLQLARASLLRDR